MLAANSLRNADYQLDQPNITESYAVPVLNGQKGCYRNSSIKYLPFEDLCQTMAVSLQTLSGTVCINSVVLIKGKSKTMYNLHGHLTHLFSQCIPHCFLHFEIQLLFFFF